MWTRVFDTGMGGHYTAVRRFPRFPRFRGDPSEAYLPAEPARAETPPWLQIQNVDCGRPQGDRVPPVARSQAVVRLTATAGEPASVVTRLKRRAEFVAASRGARWNSAAFVLQCVRRSGPGGERAIGVGFTATKRLGVAVVRNRARRRLREAARMVFPEIGRPGFDYVLVARPMALECDFQDLKAALREAVSRIADRAGKARVRA